MADARSHHRLEAMLAHRRRLAASLRDAQACQRRVLQSALRTQARTAFGVAHDFARLRTHADFVAAVPIHDYAALSPWIERAAAGERSVLTIEDPVAFFTSSGSTGAHKRIPVTAGFLRDCFIPFVSAAQSLVAERCPDVLLREDATLNLKHDVGSALAATASGRPHLGVSQLDFRALGERFPEPGTTAPWSQLPDALAGEQTLARLYYRVRLAAQHDVRCVVGINPAHVAALPWLLARWGERIVREVRDGTLGGLPYRDPDPERARRLERLADQCGALLPAHLWPRMELLVCWTGGLAALYLPRVAAAYGAGARVHPAPLAASEGPIALALHGGGEPGPLVVSSVYYEFVPADDALGPDCTTHRFDELDDGAEYHVLLTHAGGFWRYSVGDVVRVAGFEHGVPCVEYAGRSASVNVGMARLRESCVVRALGAAASDIGIELVNATCRPGRDTVGGRRLEVAVALAAAAAPAARPAMARAVDRRLCESSSAYRAARADGELAPARLHLTAPDAFLREWERRVEAGNRPPQVKDRVFWTGEGWPRLLQSGRESARAAA